MNTKNTIVLIAIIVGILFITTVVKIYASAHGELKLAQKLVQEKRLTDAIPHFERAIHWYLPGLDVTDKAAQGLWDTAQTFETTGELQKALDSYRLLRGAFYSTRSVFTPGKEWIARCNEKIAALMAQGPPTSESEKGLSFEQRKENYLKLLEAEKSPRPGWAVLTEVGFFGWVLCAVFFIVLAVSKTGTVKPRPAWTLTGGFVAFYALWIWGMFHV